jgi:hypothetical protein
MMPKQLEFVPRGRKADPVDRQWACELAARVGLVRAAKVTGVSRSALANVLADLTVYPGTVAVIREARLRASATAA